MLRHLTLPSWYLKALSISSTQTINALVTLQIWSSLIQLYAYCIHRYAYALVLYILHVKKNSGTSNKGHSAIRTQYKKKIDNTIRQVFLPQISTFLYFQCTIKLREEDLSLLRTKLASLKVSIPLCLKIPHKFPRLYVHTTTCLTHAAYIVQVTFSCANYHTTISNSFTLVLNLLFARRLMNMYSTPYL